MNKTNLWLIGIAFLVIVVMVILGNVIVVGDHIATIPYCGLYLSYLFYALLVGLFFWAFILPFIRIHLASEMPVLSMDKDEDSAQLKKFADTLAANCGYIPDKKKRARHVEELRRCISLTGSDREKLREVVGNEITTRIDGNEDLGVVGINRRIDLWAERVLVATAISQNSKLDSVIVLWNNYKMVSDIVYASGFRPNSRQLVRIYFNVIATALFSYVVSDGLSDMDSVQPFNFGDGGDIDITDVATDVSDTTREGNSFILGLLRKISIPGIAVSSLLDGATIFN